MRFSILLALSAASAFGQYTYYYGDSFSTIDTTKWWVNPNPSQSLNGSANGLWGQGSVISKVAVPDGTSDYEVKATFIPAPYYFAGISWSATSLYLRASSDANLTAQTGTFYAVATFYQSGQLWLSVLKRQNNALTTLLQTAVVGVTTPVTFRASIRSDSYAAGITVRFGSQSWFIADTSIPSGQPGIGVTSPGGGGPQNFPISRIDLGPLDRVGPNPPPSAITTASFPDKTIFSWSSTPADDPNGVGFKQYRVLRDGALISTTVGTTCTDEAVVSGNTYTYSIISEDWHGTVGQPTTLTVTTPTYSNPDPRRTGITPTGAYWGTTGEQIDILSGNLNFTLPLLKAVSRGSWSVPFNLTYNSQSFRYVSSPNPGTILHNADVGYGFGWRLLAGAIVPVYSGSTLLHYIFLDSTGGEHKLNFNDGGMWRGATGLHVQYDENLHRVYFNDGTFWQMNCISSGNEPDLGTRYPTLMQDSNGNQIVIRYMPAVGSSTANTSARISGIDDVRTNFTCTASYDYCAFKFNYNTDATPHLTSIFNYINSSEKYDFTYSGLTSLNSPFDGTAILGPQVKMLSTATVTGLNLGHIFDYTNAYGELTKVIFPYGGEFRYEYLTWTNVNGHKLREIANRYLVKQPGATPVQYYIGRDTAGDVARPIHLYGTVYDTGASAEKVWFFYQTGDWRMGLPSEFWQRRVPDATILHREYYSYTLAPSGFPYVSNTLLVKDPGTAHEKRSQIEQALDTFGNMTQKKEYDFGNLTTPARTTNCTYVTDANYVNRFLRNLLKSCTLTAGSTTYTVVTNAYDEPGRMDSQSLPLRLHDTANYSSSFIVRGNLTRITSLGSQDQMIYYNMVGKPIQVYQQVHSVNGPTYRSQTISYPSSYAVPTQFTASSAIQTTLTYTSFLGVTSATQANGTAVNFSYDAYARPAIQSTPDGNITFTYASSAPFWRQGTIAGRWTKTWYDGFGRTIKEESGDGSGTKSIAETEYDSCGCSPLGKVKRVSRPYAPGGTVYWATYTYDVLGRTVSISQPNGSGSTTYSYQGNTTTVSDQAGRWKKFTTDAFGNLTQVNEPNPAGGTDYVTTYTYNGLNKLMQVTMPRPTGTQTRTFGYNTQGQLASETHPESGVTTYTYGGGGFLISKMDAKGQRTEWSYDLYRRVTEERHYNPANNELLCERVNYIYDGYNGTLSGGLSNNTVRGRLGEVLWGQPNPTVCGIGQFREQYGYDWEGRISTKYLRLRQTYQPTGSPLFDHEASLGAWWITSHGKKTYLRYPGTSAGARSTNYTLNGTAQLVGMTQTTTSGTLPVVSNVQYGPAGELTQMQYNGATETRTYNALQQLTGISYNGVLRHEYRYSATNNDGKLTSYKNWQSGEDVQYQYDTLGRLASAQTVGPEWGQSFDYDGFGNLWSKAVTKGTASTLNVAVDAATNRITGVSGLSYDSNGNMNNIPGIGTVAYDGRNRQVGINLPTNGAPTQGYDATNRKIWQVSAGNRTVDFYLPTGEKLGTYRLDIVYDFGTPAGLQFVKVREHLYFDGRLIKTEGAMGNPSYVEWVNQDRLGSAVSHLPYGEERTVTAQDRMKFATYWRENNGLDYAQNRYYSSVYGRFTTPDPYRASGGPADPGSWNRYAYVQGDPINFNDPSGLWLCPIGGGGCSSGVYGDEFGMDEGFGSEGGGRGWTLGGWINPICGSLGFSPGGFCLVPIIPVLAAGGGQSARRVPTFLQVVNDCYHVPSSGPVTREISYRLYDDSAIPLAYTHATITEHLAGDLPITGRSNSGPPNGRYDDQHSILAGKPIQQLKQTFTVDTEDGQRGVSVFVRGFTDSSGTPTDYGVLSITKNRSYISINGDPGGTFVHRGKFVPNKICD